MVLDEGISRRGYRGRLGIIRDILQVAQDASSAGTRKTHLMYGANLSYRLLSRYLEEILRSGLICEGNCRYAITEKGKDFLRIYEDYEKYYTEIERHKLNLRNGREELEKMLTC